MSNRGYVERVIFPGAGDRAEAVARFAAKGGVITAYSDSRLPALRLLVPEEEADVSLLGDVVGRVLRGAGVPNTSLASTGQLKALIGLACQNLPPESAFYASGGFDGTHECLAETLSELRRWGYRPEDLDRTLAEVGPRPTIAAMAQVMRAVADGLEELRRGTLPDRIDACLQLGPIDITAFRRILVDAGPDRPPLFEAWLRWLADSGVYVEVLRESLDAETRNWAKRLCGGNPSGAPPEVEILEAPDILSECEWALRGCLAARGEGILDHRMAIVARSREEYGPLLLAAASRLGVPIRAGFPVPLLTNGFIAFVDACLEVAASKDVRRLVSLVRRSYCGLSTEARREAEAMLRSASRSGPRAWESIQEWAREQGSQAAWIEHYARWTIEAQTRTGTLPEWIGRLRLLLEGGNLIERVTSNPETAHRDLRAQTSMERSLLDYASAFHDGGPVLTLSGFASLARTIWEAEDTVLPGSESGIAVVASAHQLGECDVVFVLGMLEGVFPRRRREDPILGDYERILLQRPDDPVPLPLSQSIAQEERMEFVHLCAAPRRRLVLSYPFSGETRDNIPAFYLSEISDLLGERVIQTKRLRADIAPSTSGSSADQRLAHALTEQPKHAPRLERLQVPEAKRAVRPEIEEEGIDPREAALASECPFRAVARHRLRLYPGASRDPWRPIWRLPMAAGLPIAPDRKSAREALRAALASELDRLVGELDGWQIRVIEGSALRLIDGWIEREFEARAAWPREVRTNVSNDDPDLRNRLPLSDGRIVRLAGQIDTVLQMSPYRGISLYQARRPQFRKVEDQLNAEELLQGLQLLIVSTKKGSVAAEIDFADGERHLYVVQRIENDGLTQNPTCRIYALAESWAAYAKLVKSALVEAIKTLEAADMEARPGDYCTTCDFGELCRASRDFGEVDDPFLSRFDGDDSDSA